MLGGKLGRRFVKPPITMTIERRDFLKIAAASTLPLTAKINASNQQPALIRKPIPSSGETIPVVGIGTNRYGVGDDVDAMRPLRDVLSEFSKIEGGVIDTAPLYRNSESVLGRLIKELGISENFFVATKCDEVGADATRNQLVSSEKKLESGTLDLVAIHNLRHWQQQLPVLREAKEDGRIRYLGITTSRDSQYAEFKQVLESEPLDFMQINYSLADRGAESLMTLAQERGVAVMINLPFGRGKLFSAVASARLPEWSAEFDAGSWAQFFLKYVISHPAVVCAIPGTRKVRHLRDNLAAATGRLPNAKQRQAMEEFFDGLPEL